MGRWEVSFNFESQRWTAKKIECTENADSIPREAGLEKYLNFTLPSNPQVLLARGTFPLAKFSNSLIIHEPNNGFSCNKTILNVVLFVLITSVFTPLYLIVILLQL